MYYRSFISIALIFASSIAYGVDALLITKEGKTIVAYKVAKSNDLVRYTTRENKKQSIKVSELYQILPKVVRGQKYEPDVVRKYIRYARKAINKFKLRKQLQPMLDEWLIIRKQFKSLTPEVMAEMKEKIEELFTTYEESKKTSVDFNELRANLEMIRYRDLQGVFEDAIDPRLEAINTAFINSSYGTVKKICTRKRIKAADFMEAEALAKNHHTYSPPQEQLDVIKKLIPKARKVCVKTAIRNAKSTFRMGEGTINDYPQVNGELTLLLSGIAKKSEYPSIYKARKFAQSQLLAYDFSFPGMKDFPVSRKNQLTLEAVGKKSRLSSPHQYPHAIMFPTKSISKVKGSKSQSISFRAVFARKPPKGILGLHVWPWDLHLWSVARIKNAEATVKFSTRSLRGKKVEWPEGTVNPLIVFTLIVKEHGKKKEDSIALSNWMGFPFEK